MDKGNYNKLKPVETLGMDICGGWTINFHLDLYLTEFYSDWTQLTMLSGNIRL